MSSGWRVLLIVAAASAAVVLFVVLRADDDETTAPPPRPPASTIRDPLNPPPRQAPLEILIPVNTDAITRRTIPRGRQVVLVVSGAEDEEIHLHGYDIRLRTGPEGVARLAFRATIRGRFEVELEGSHTQIADLTVR